MAQFLILARKDLILELRRKETLILAVGLSLLLSMIVAFGIGSSFIGATTTRKLFSVFLWLVFIFTATLSIGRSYEYEMRNHALEGLLLCGISPTWIFLAKTLSNAVVIGIAHLITILLLSVLLNCPIASEAGMLLVISALVVIGYATLATLLAGITVSSRLSSMLLPLILIPLLFPLFFAALELTADLMQTGTLAWESAWFSLLFGLDVLYLLFGINLFEYVVEE